MNGYTAAGPRSGGTAHVAAPWQRATRGESRWPAVIAVLAASALQMALPGWLSLGPHWLLPALELGLLCALVTSSPGRLERRSAALRAGGLALAGLLSLANAISTALLVNELAHGSAAESAAALLLAGGSIWAANVLIFALWYWELDRAARRTGATRCGCTRTFCSRRCSSLTLPPPTGSRPSPTTCTCRS